MTAATTQRPRSQPAAPPRRWLRRIVWTIVLVVLLALLLPYVLVPLYRFVDPVSTLMLARWATGARVERTFVPLDRIAPVLPVTVIASEDGRFCRHRGVDLKELRERIEAADDISEARGVSTITQQVAKNLFLWPGRSFVRKALELPLAMWIDVVLPKWRVLEIYLNIAEWGPRGEFGAEAASRYAFNKPAGRCRRAKPPCWPPCCPIRIAGAPVSRARPCAGSPAFTRPGAPPRSGWRVAPSVRRAEARAKLARSSVGSPQISARRARNRHFGSIWSCPSPSLPGSVPL